MKINKIIILFLLLPFVALAQDLKVGKLQCEYKSDPQGIEEASPKLSWQLQSTGHNIIQTSYRVLVASNKTLLDQNKGDVWDSKKVSSSASIQVGYAGKPLASARTYYWKVMVWDNQQHTSAWSKPAHWQMGLPSKADWKGAQWIAYDRLPDSSKITPLIHLRGPKKLGPANDVLPLLRKEFKVTKAVKRATIYISGLGHFELSINGQKTGDHFLDPGWTGYDKQALYVPFDVTDQIKQGSNAIGVMLGNGFYFIPRDARYRKLTGAYGYPKMICRLVTEYTDGTTDNVISDQSWTTAPGPITYTSIYGGEDYNANLEQPGWDKPGFNDARWKKAMVVEGVPQLDAQIAEPLKVFEQFAPKTVKELGPGVTGQATKSKDPTFKPKMMTNRVLYDFGQNLSGIVRITVKGKRGDTVRIYPAELLTKEGTIDQKGSGNPHYYDYILKGTGEETWQPRFTYYGFRYAQVENAVSSGSANPHQLPVITAIKSLHTRNASAIVGNFSCSNELFNRTFKLIDWAIKSNMASVFTDCPHREKLGWLEEAHLVGGSIRYIYDIANLSRKCINDMQVAQTPEGLVPEIAPEFTNFGGIFRDSPEWGSNSIILPWYVYQWYGDKKVLADSYPMMERYLIYLNGMAKDNILSQGLGDWFDIGPKSPGLSQNTPQGITATAIYYYDLQIIAQIARLLGKSADAVRYEKLAGEVKTSFNKSFFDASTKQYGTGSQTANAIAMYCGLLDAKDKAAVLDNIVKDIRTRNNALTAGDIGYRYLLRVLDDNGRSDVIFEMNNRSDVPGYGYQLAKGATALTESWQALPGVSNNHLMLGHLMEWFYSGLAGIKQPDDATGIGFRHIEIRPEPVGDVTFAKASYNSPYGMISSDWKKEGKKFVLDVEIPANARASVHLPANKGDKVQMNGKPVAAAWKDGKAELKVGSGRYHLVVE
ncbi:glycoside hydrolase family 78 protein [Mucilaginibacter daejeonensis]|uniref:family 78 glycoside hydrolase catalytic domain n=1 Tax=Mucilaginibacter daejeonensis TaxID=398049 RepID=UPI001D177EF1|nr:family 78 glycoside hydrolase catalytic domain [Mucilaginibacter daejeonensis]UEG52858.1 glycoside hydrolase family 78 protein [Mucilaginibacter daejeonensis]